MKALGYRVVDILVNHFDTLRETPVSRKATKPELEKLFRRPFPERKSDAENVLQKLERDLFTNIMHLDHPRFFAFVPSPSNFVSVMADSLASGFNVFAGTWLESSAAAEIELVTVDWLRQELGLPEAAGGLFVSGGSMANLTALAVACRVRKVPRKSRRPLVYCSDQTHSSLERGLRVLGFESSQIRKLRSDNRFRLRVSDLRSQLVNDRKAGRIPFCVIGNAGTTSTGAVDPLAEIAELCNEEEMWFHVDGAYGAASIMCNRGRGLLGGIERADSLSIDPHKWMFQPYEIGCVLVRNNQWLRDTFRILPEYLKDIDRSQKEVNFCDYGIQLTRGFRALKLWMSLEVFGVESFRKAVERGLTLAEFAEKELRRSSSKWQVVTPASMGIVTFRFTPESPHRLSSSRIDMMNQQLVNKMQAQGFAMISSTVLRGQTVLRMCTINPRARENDIRQTIRMLGRWGNELSRSQ
jgi:glutamate/tyrosine decarboxylase-like PLP-dependent enzyme